MITIPTVLVLGAGASVHVGYPLGSALINNLCQQHRVGSDNDLPINWTVDDSDRLVTRLSRAGYYSIDAFLEKVPDQADLGKYLIARELKRHEIMDALFPSNNAGWYQYLFNRLLDNDCASGFESSRLSIITFNYDRSLEVYLHEALIARFGLSSDDASSTISHIPIIHVHGSLGQYPVVPYESQCDSNELLEISRHIKIIHEVPDPKNDFCNREFEQANNLLHEAKRIFFLGFGFHPDNIRRFRFFTPENTVDRDIFATTRGMGPVEIDALASRLEPLGIEHTALNSHPCNRVFTHAATLQ